MQHDLELIDVNKIFDNGTAAVVDFNLAVERGEFVSFLGPSGCGKTTTLRMIGGFESSTSGRIMIRGNQVDQLPPEKRPTSMIFQNYALFPHMTVRENIEYGLVVKKLAPAERRRKADAMMQTVGLTDVAERKLDGLSGGQRQRIALARGLVVEPEILLLDEPLGSLDANLRKDIQNELKILQANLGITFVFVTHAQSEALVLSDRIVVMNRGIAEQISPPFELYTRPKTAFVATFIGRNTMLSGTYKGAEGAIGAIETRFGPLAGFVNDPGLVAGKGGHVVIPSEAVEIFADTADERGRLAQRYGGNVIPVRLTGSQVVGHKLYFDLELADGHRINVETYASKYPPELTRSDHQVLMAWAANEATLVRQEA
ncbi:MAG: ABC transporter ATP-binding protein [Alphaproteobacteria bacterium]